MSYNLKSYKFSELKEIGKKLGIPLHRSKEKMIKEITRAFDEYREYEEKTIGRYTFHQQLGGKGREGRTFLVTNRKGQEYAMKTFRQNKSSRSLQREYELQKKAAEVGVAPKVYDYDTVSNYIVMDKMDSHLLDVLEKQRKLFKYQQKRLIEIFQALDQCGVFHNDANLLNYMVKGKKIYIIDFGMAKEITPRLIRELGTDRPNMKFMLLGFILKMRDFNVPRNSYSYLLKYVKKEDRERFQL